MLTKEQKIEALQKLLNNIDVIDIDNAKAGLCDLCKYLISLGILNEIENSFIKELIIKDYFLIPQILRNGFLFTPFKQEPRRKWLQEQIENLKNQ